MNKMVKELIEAAKREDWDFVDNRLPEAVKDKSNVSWASVEGLNDRDGNVRDLAASMLEKADISPSELPNVRKGLGSHLEDSHPYARFRAACALAAHGPGDYMVDVLIVLKEFRDNKDVRDIARRYLRQLSQA